mmetsp:Transcript_21113/g.29043  ORF Transcript_21113/g.29043 Transcript_21113/m.29043 type:complete len:522 (-) Transcript_21113:41-1606(-)
MAFFLIAFLLIFMRYHDYKNIENVNTIRYSLRRFKDVSKLRDSHQIQPEISLNFSEQIINSHLLRKQEYDITIYIRALYNSVKIVSIPPTKTFLSATRDCSKHVKANIDYSQHSLEQHFPQTLLMMEYVAQYHNFSTTSYNKSLDKTSFEFLWSSNSSSTLQSNSAFSHPLFYYIHMFPYFVVYCTRKSRDKENWEAGLHYTVDVANTVVKSTEWSLNSGLDFLSPASHPKSGPLNIHDNVLKTFTRHTFMRTDFDLMGYAPKDIVVPYYIPSSSLSQLPQEPKRLLLFFAGGDNPPGGLRSEFEASFLSLQSRQQPLSPSQQPEVFFAVSSQLSADEYSARMASSEFCLMLRGDTASSKRLFSAVSCGCIPVIVSDWIPLPFEALIDYSQFSLRFSESSFRDVQGLLSFLRREMSLAKRATMRTALQLARSLLLFQTFSEPSAAKPTRNKDVETVQKQQSESSEVADGGNVECYLLNPVTLTLIEAFIRRKKYCDDLSLPSSNLMCINLYSRLSSALDAS